MGYYIEGKVFLSAMTDRYTCKTQKNVSKVCLGAKYQSKFLSLYMNNDYKNMCALLEALGVKNAIFTISAFVKNNKLYHNNRCGCRGFDYPYPNPVRRLNSRFTCYLNDWKRLPKYYYYSSGSILPDSYGSDIYQDRLTRAYAIGGIFLAFLFNFITHL